jgi:hypothetical protein
MPACPASAEHPNACRVCEAIGPACCPPPHYLPATLSLLPAAGAKLAEFDLGPIELGKARRSGTVAASVDDAAAVEGNATVPAAATAAATMGNGSAAAADEAVAGQPVLAAAAAAAPAVPQINRRCKRRRRELLEASA